MVCHKCLGLMVSDQLDYGLPGMPIVLWRCVNCGELIDIIILLNREKKLYYRKGRIGKYGEKRNEYL